MLHDSMPCDPIQGHGGPKFVKMVDFKVYLLCQYACNQMVNYDTVRHCENFN